MNKRGVTLEQVAIARERLLERGKNPTIDAVRVQLGNTGSKSTISKYLQELSSRAPAPERKTSDAILALVERLAEELEGEAGRALEKAEAEHREQKKLWLQKEEERAGEVDQAREAQAEADERASRLEALLADVRAQLKSESERRGALEQELDHARSALDQEREHHRASLRALEHAQNSLDHFREASRAQREEDAKRHDAQLQGLNTEIKGLRESLALKQDSLTSAREEAARLAAENTRLDTDLRDTKQIVRQCEDEIAASQARRDVMAEEVKGWIQKHAAEERAHTQASHDLDKMTSSFERKVEENHALRQQQQRLEQQVEALQATIASLRGGGDGKGSDDGLPGEKS